VFNVGAGAFQKSTLLKRIKANQEEHLIRHEFSRWDKAGGKVLAGLVRRRQDEANLYFNGQ
jgi:lysozyme